MLYGLVLVIHVMVSLILIGVILLQGGRGGLSDALGGAAAQSLFGGGAATVLTRVTACCAGLFVVTCLSLAYLSTAKGRSVIEQMPAMNPQSFPPISAAQPRSFVKPSAAPATTGAAASSGTQATQTEQAKPVSQSGTTNQPAEPR